MPTNFSFTNLIKEHIDNSSYSANNKKIIEEGRSISIGLGNTRGLQIPLEYRSVDSSSGGPLIGEDVIGLSEPLRNTLAAAKAGATFLTGLKGDVVIPVYYGSQAFWKGESVDSEEGSRSFKGIRPKVKRLTACLDVSKLLLLQATPESESILRQDMVNAIAEKLNAAIFSNDSVDPNRPEGFFSDVSDSDFDTIGSGWTQLLDMEKKLDNNKMRRDSRAYIINGNGNRLLKNTPKADNNPFFLLENDKMNGYPVYVTNNIPSGLTSSQNKEGIVFGNWSDLVICQWGALDITVDPYTKASKGVIELTIDMYLDVVKRYSEAFAIGHL